MLCAVALTGCASVRYDPAPKVGTDISGHWIIDPAPRAEVERLIAASLPKPRPARWERSVEDDAVGRDPRDPNGTRPSGGGRGSSGQRRGQPSDAPVAQPMSDRPTAWGRVLPGDFVRAFALPPHRLDIQQQPDSVTIGTADRRRSFVPGDDEPRSVTDRYGSRRVQGGWQSDEFLITAVDGSRLSVREHYRRLADDRLEVRVEFEAAGLKSLRLQSVYRRATDADIGTSLLDEGPPLPVAR